MGGGGGGQSEIAFFLSTFLVLFNKHVSCNNSVGCFIFVKRQQLPATSVISTCP